MPLFFNSANDGVGCFSPAALDNIWAGGATVVGWFNAWNWGEGGYGRILAKANSTADGSGWGVKTNSPKLVFAHDFSTARGEWETPSPSVALDTWYHAAVSYDKGSAANDPAMYLDGVAQAVTENLTPSGTAADDSGEEFCIGNLATDNTVRALGAYLDDWRVYDRILTANEIACIANARGADGIVDGLVARWLMGDSKVDQSGGDQGGYIGVGWTGAAASVVANVPSQAADGDLMVMVIASSGDTSGTAEDITTPSGWTLANSGQTDLPSSSSTPSVWVYYRTASSEPASYTVTGNQTSAKIAIIQHFKNLGTTPDVSSSINTGNDASPVAPSITPSAAAMAMRVCCVDDITGTIYADSSANFPSTLNARVSFPQGGTGNGMSLLIGTELVGAGATGTRTFSLIGAEQWGCLSFAFLGGQGARSDYLVDCAGNKFASRIQASPAFSGNRVIRSRRKVA